MEAALSLHAAMLGDAGESAAGARGPASPAKSAAYDVHREPLAVTLPSVLLGGAPKEGENPGNPWHARAGEPSEARRLRRPQEGENPELSVYPHIRQRGLLRIDVYTYYPSTDPEYTITFDANLSHIPGDDPCWADSDSFTRYMEYSIWHKLCPIHWGRLHEFPIPRGDFDPPIGCDRFLQKVWTRGVFVTYVVCWPDGWAARRPTSSTSPSSRPSTPRSASCSSTRGPASTSPSEPQPSSPPPSAPEPLP
jgi:hypothetical protein